MDLRYNRIVIVGNGFDKALGLKTSYSEFILDFLKENIINAVKQKPYFSKLLTISVNKSFSLDDPNFFMDLDNIESTKELDDFLTNYIHFKPTLVFLKEIIAQNNETNWVDIEQHYFKTLVAEYNHYIRHDLDKIHKDVFKLNECMDELSKALNNYINKIQNHNKINYLESNLHELFDTDFREPLVHKKIKHIRKSPFTNAPSEVIFLNFNYTNTVKKFIENSYWDKPKPHHIAIHGRAGSRDYPIIFGYGDDNSDTYKKLEIEDENEWIRMIKSFQYGRDSNYHDFLNYIGSIDYDVFIIGHSCGMSDKTLLKTIFEHDKCIAIQNYHYKGQEEHFYKIMQISRHFEDKALMRERVLPFDEHARIPQDK